MLLLVGQTALANGEFATPDEIDDMVERGIYYLNVNPDSAFFYAKQAMDLSEANDYQKGLALSKRVIGQIFYLQGGYDQSIAYLLESSEHFRKIEDQEGLADNHIALGIAYQYALRLEDALSQFKKSLAIYGELNHISGVAEAYGNLGHYFEKSGMYDSAFYFQHQALELFSAEGNEAGIAIIYDNLGSIHEDLGEYDQAHEYFLQSAHYDSLSENHAALVVSMNNIGDTFRKRKIYDRALDYTARALALAKELRLAYQVRSAYRDFAKTYSEMQQMDLAYAYMDSIYDLNESIFSTQIASQIANLQTLYDTRQKEQEIALLESQKVIARNSRNSIVAGAFGLFLFAGAMIYQLRARNQKNKAFFEAEQSLNKEKLKNIQLKEKSLQTELENNRLREERLHAELETRSQELTTKALHIIQKNRLLNELRTQLNELFKDAKAKGQQRSLKKLSGLIDSGFKFDKDWDEFVSVFDQVHTDFFDRLKADNPNLTASELRLCSLIRLNLNSRDIATILAISQDSLRISRYRLRKKLGLSKGDNLTNYIIRI